MALNWVRIGNALPQRSSEAFVATGFSLCASELRTRGKPHRLKPVLPRGFARYRGLCSNAYGCGLYLEPAKKRMLAATTRRNRLALVQKPEPRLKPGWALLRVRLAGICNTDIEILRGYHNFQGTIGHR